MKRRTLKVLALGLIASVSIGVFTGCYKKNDDKKIGMVVSTLNNPFFVSMKEGAEQKAKELGYDLVVLDSQNDPAKERSNVEDLVQLGVTAVLINPTDSDAVETAVKVANNKNVPVITLDRQSNGGEVACHIASDNIKGGQMAAEFALDKLKNKDNILVAEIQGIPGASATRDRGKGFHDILDEKSNIKFVSSQAADFDRQKGLQVMENIIQATPEFDIVFAHNDEMALGAAKALKTVNKDVIIIGFDGNDDAKEAVDKGDMTATVAQQPDLIGSLGVEVSHNIRSGKNVQKQVAADLKIYTKDN
ncbi:ribose ABC transporter substrate-binding protein RbsB [Clostridium fallax]|uniref:Ribose-binding protein n=1 Tax=Clostridium fallax TaxID=1533 RepID=A0A1M4UGI1_9CLOT|nr:ribose ABC transporter substrate-binding protein RbsB [Clostridium fallax]SHE55775.1 ribose-binding protein [Clostridium fallax]SQB07547.1 ABC-type sugar transport system, periplasmic component [Clostridium fallax]